MKCFLNFLIILYCFHYVLSLNKLDCIEKYLIQHNFSGNFTSNKNNTEFLKTIDIDNARCVSTPLIILFPLSSEDVSLGIKASTSCNISFSVISGGHSAGCFSLTKEGVTINLKLMNRIEVDFETGVAKTQGGTIWQKIYEYIYNHTDFTKDSYLSPVGGGCPYVGVGGFFTGGGWAFISRSYGLAIDLLMEIEVVLADGRIIKANNSEECNRNIVCRETWWANRGGGGGNFGIITDFTFKLVRVPSKILIGDLCWEQDTPLLDKVWGWLYDSFSKLPDWIQIDSAYLPLGKNNSRIFCHTIICNNADEKACRDILKPLYDIGEISLDSLGMQPYLNWTMNNVNVTSAQHGNLYLTNFMMEEDAYTVDVALKIQNAVLTAPSNRSIMTTHMGGGMISKISDSETAFPHRKSHFVLQLKSIWSSKSPEDAEKNIKWINDLKEWLTPLSSGTYVNYIDPYLDDFERRYYKDNLPRLQAAKALLDPTNVFRFNQSISLVDSNNIDTIWKSLYE